VIENGDKVFWRDANREEAARSLLFELGFKNGNAGPNRWSISDTDFGESVRTLLEQGWTVEADGKPVRKADRTHIEVRSGVDWFELHGSVDFHGQTTSLPELLKAVRRGDRAIALGDGTIGLLPEEWLSRYQKAAAMGTAENEHIAFSRSQVALLDFLLETEPEAVFDETFSTLRNHIRSFEGVQPADPSKDFIGTLREYQREGLGWLQFLRQFGFGGCLADDMGLGKTIQVLAMFASFKRENDGGSSKTALDALAPRPSLVVVPRSLIFNWKDEAARFVPSLKVLDYTGLGRSRLRDRINNHDIVLTTYGTLRRDAAVLKEIRFNTVVFDEAQAIKNSKTASAKAARLLKSDHRLALTGTPVENHLGELWSLFEVLNPGMLGSVRTFENAVSSSRTADPDLELVSRGLRPFILRRTKSEVMKELPEKIEQTIYCELKPKQRRMYNELRQFYKESLLNGATDAGIRRSKIKVLEALLRLRQASCHPGLIDKERTGENSAKLDALIPLITEVIESGAKALVFSQFTSLLAIVRQRFDDLGVTYEYLDGKTRNRAERVHRFQNDDACPLFLISLKAGGLGLNLTAAEYVFILDPWWNPAAEAQAIDRTHRIGQSRQVFAYRLIAKDTVEERILELQQTKKELAGAIIGNQNSLVRSLGREDLEVLFN
jgi:SNF2 family DNA or RNA helicase